MKMFDASIFSRIVLVHVLPSGIVQLQNTNKACSYKREVQMQNVDEFEGDLSINSISSISCFVYPTLFRNWIFQKICWSGK